MNGRTLGLIALAVMTAVASFAAWALYTYGAFGFVVDKRVIHVRDGLVFELQIDSGDWPLISRTKQWIIVSEGTWDACAMGASYPQCN